MLGRTWGRLAPGIALTFWGHIPGWEWVWAAVAFLALEGLSSELLASDEAHGGLRCWWSTEGGTVLRRTAGLAYHIRNLAYLAAWAAWLQQAWWQLPPGWARLAGLALGGGLLVMLGKPAPHWVKTSLLVLCGALAVVFGIGRPVAAGTIPPSVLLVAWWLLVATDTEEGRWWLRGKRQWRVRQIGVAGAGLGAVAALLAFRGVVPTHSQAAWLLVLVLALASALPIPDGPRPGWPRRLSGSQGAALTGIGVALASLAPAWFWEWLWAWALIAALAIPGVLWVWQHRVRPHMHRAVPELGMGAVVCLGGAWAIGIWMASAWTWLPGALLAGACWLLAWEWVRSLAIGSAPFGDSGTTHET